MIADTLLQVTEETDEFIPRVFVVAFTDSVHSLQFADVTDRVKEFFSQVQLDDFNIES